MRKQTKNVDVVGVGLNATDTIIRLPQFPRADSKVELLSSELRAGGQVASAMAACQKWGLRARYIGKIGDDAAGVFQTQEMARDGVEAHWILVRGCPSQTAYILVDKKARERTILWKRDPRLAIRSAELRRSWICGARALLVDGHDPAAATRAARWARKAHIPVVGDFDRCYPGLQVLLKYVDFVLTSKGFPEQLSGERDLLRALPKLLRKFKSRLMGATLGGLGVLAWDGGRFVLCRGFVVKAVDTTGAGDIFHGGFVYGLVHGWPLEEILEFSCAAAALNCRAVGARGGIASLAQIEKLRRHGVRSKAAYSEAELREATAAVRKASGVGR